LHVIVEVTTTLQGNLFHAILVGGFIVGVLDLSYAMIVYTPHHPILIPQFIASGVLGDRSFDGGCRTAALGVALHFLIAFTAATVYCLTSRKLPFLIEHAVICGMIFGGLVFAFMHIVVIPLSRVNHHPMHFAYAAAEFVWHWIGVGLPISLSCRYYSR
jgi:uncharacterized membrane protein YagU involved in acid resistance